MTATGSNPRVFLSCPESLHRAAASIKQDEPTLRSAVRSLVVALEAALDFAPVSVMDKGVAPPSGDKHDYMSMGPYWWPNPDTPDGLPYIRRDGEVNPYRHGFDNASMAAMSGQVETLALGWYLLDDAKSAEHASLLLRTWFLDEATRMNPHLEYGQAIPGVCDGRGIGIIDAARRFSRLVDAIGLLETSGQLTDTDSSGLHMWMHSFRTWLQDSDKGKDESSQSNNHGTWFDVLLSSLALYTGDTELVREVSTSAEGERIGKQIEPDGAQPLELARVCRSG